MWQSLTWLTERFSYHKKKFHKENLDLVRLFLRLNKYPEPFFEGLIVKRLCVLRNKDLKNKRIIITLADPDGNSSIPFTSGDLPIFSPVVPIPYVRGFSEKTNRLLIRQHNVTSVSVTNSNLSNIVLKGKDRLPATLQTNVVYKISCKNCPASYVGQTKRELLVRIKEHSATSEKVRTKKQRLNKVVEPEDHSVISEHESKFKHTFDWDRVRILNKETKLGKRLTSEMIHIHWQSHPLHKQEDTKNLHAPYGLLLHKLRSKSVS